MTGVTGRAGKLPSVNLLIIIFLFLTQKLGNLYKIDRKNKNKEQFN